MAAGVSQAGKWEAFPPKLSYSVEQQGHGTLINTLVDSLSFEIMFICQVVFLLENKEKSALW